MYLLVGGVIVGRCSRGVDRSVEFLSEVALDGRVGRLSSSTLATTVEKAEEHLEDPEADDPIAFLMIGSAALVDRDDDTEISV